MAKLVVNPSSPSRREVPLSRVSILTIGRDPSNDMVLPDAMVSRRHAVIEVRGGGFFLRDCGSANGSVVNGDRVSERDLRDGDLVAIGSTRFLFREEPPDTGSGKVVPHPSALPLRCPSCGGEYRRGDLFCRACGAQVAQPTGPPRVACPSCGTSVPLPARFCTACGTTLVAGDGAAGGPGVEDAPEPDRPDTQPVAVPARADGSSAPLASGSMAMAPEPHAVQHVSAAPSARAAPGQGWPGLARVSRTGTAAPASSRFVAALVDAVFVLSGQSLLLAPVAWYWWAREAPRTPADVSFLPVLASVGVLPLALLLAGLYHAYFWSAKGATPGKELLDLRVETEEGISPIGFGRAALRVFGYLLGVASLGVGFAMIVSRGGALHDRIAGTRVVKGPRR